jgi:hypothetical protein
MRIVPDKRLERIIIIVVALFAAIAIPSFSKYREARQALPEVSKNEQTLAVSVVGEVKIKTYTSNPEPTSPPFITITDASGKLFKRIDFQLTGAGSYPSVAKFKTIKPAKDLNQLIVAVASSPGGSDIHFETTIIGFINGKVSELLSKHIDSSSQDALCMDNKDKNQKLRFIFFHFLWEEAHYEPHRYEAVSYIWDGNAFNPSDTVQSKNKHKEWKGAASELGYSCSHDLISEINHDYK